MFATIILIIFILSFGGVLFILARKMPALVDLPQNGVGGIKDHRLFVALQDKIKNIVIAFEKQIFFHKFLSWVKVMTLKIETKVDKLLHGIRKKAQQVDKKIKDQK